MTAVDTQGDVEVLPQFRTKLGGNEQTVLFIQLGRKLADPGLTSIPFYSTTLHFCSIYRQYTTTKIKNQSFSVEFFRPKALNGGFSGIFEHLFYENRTVLPSVFTFTFAGLLPQPSKKLASGPSTWV